MKPIKRVSLIGLGALGIMYSDHIAKAIPYEDFRILVDEGRKERYQSEGIFCNGERCDFNYVTPDQEVEPADLLIFAVKYMQLEEAIQAVAKHVGKDTIILSVLNGIVSESDIGAVYGDEHNLYCVAQGMTALKEGNKMVYANKGILCFGGLNKTSNSEKVERLKAFFDMIEVPYEINNQMETKLWSKLMVNVGINQTVAYYETINEGIQKPGEARDLLIAAMEEVLMVAMSEGVALTHNDIDYWLKIIATLEPQGMPSMAQDVKAKRSTEVELFSGTIVKLAEKHKLAVPVNEMFYNHFT
jgi:2-dehydropantoate 2-reductase